MRQSLKKLNRKELLEILINQEKKITDLEKTIEDLQSKLDDKTIKIEQSGTIAEAALKLNGVYEAIDKAAEQYLENIKANVNLQKVDSDEKENKRIKKENKGTKARRTRGRVNKS